MEPRQRLMRFGFTVCVIVAGTFIGSAPTRSAFASEPPGAPAAAANADARPISGREIFLREWIANDPRSHGGDGLGPVFNDTSCVSCHNQGGVGGGGAEAKNVTLITAVRMNESEETAEETDTKQKVETVAASGNFTEATRKQAKLLEALSKLHPGLAFSRSVVLHNSGTDPQYAAWRDRVLGADIESALADQINGEMKQVGTVLRSGDGFFGTLLHATLLRTVMEVLPPDELRTEKLRLENGFETGGVERIFHAFPSQRNTTALFGIGRLDAIPDKVLETAAAKSYPEFPEITGRVARLKDGRVGRFGWKAQMASLHDFTMTACAVEIGLHVPDHPQAGVPHRLEYKPAGFDLNHEECLALVSFLKDLPAPGRREGEPPAIAQHVRSGEEQFTKIGCAACHVPDLGTATGVYSDLLLHDLGPELGDLGAYGIIQPQSPGNDPNDPLAGLLEGPAQAEAAAKAQGGIEIGLMASSIVEKLPEKMFGAGRQEWRTPPLWGVRDSAPYLHDGRAKTLEQAIAFHGGEGQLSANRFYRLKPEERAQVLTFLRSLVAPSP